MGHVESHKQKKRMMSGASRRRMGGFLFGAAQGRRCRPMTPLRAGALAPHKQSISLKSGDKMRVIPAFHRSSFEVGIACDFLLRGRRLSICLICAGVLP